MKTPAPPLDLLQLRSHLKGEVLGPGDPGYDDSRAVFLSGIDRCPLAIARPADTDDVVRVVSIASESGVELAVRGGGHSLPGYGTSDGGIVLDLSSMKALDIDIEGRTAWAQTGLTAGEYTAAVGAHGLATGFGDAPTVGIGGITLAGGLGFLLRKHGLTIDDLLGAELVTADGEVRHVDAESEPDLFWAIRGGGGNFGVATRLRFRLHELDEIVGGMLILPGTPEVVASFIEAADAAPDELSAVAAVMLAPPMPFVPPEHHGRPALMVQLVHAGGGEAGEAAVAPLRELATPIADQVRPMRYAEIYEADPPHPFAAVSRIGFTDRIDRDEAAAIVEGVESGTAPMSVVQVRVLGGAMARVPAEATAFAHRDRRIMTNVVAVAYEPGAEMAEHEPWVTRMASALQNGDAGAYAGFLGDEGEGRVREAYPGPTWDRLVETKRRYDPTNLFRLNQNLSADGTA